ncbi:MAG TPA: T9SS type A sorting domain-containing protein [Bacteroidia bacterium]|nr:T9SS type A sorting domain-containing protein [Bacteroidia bacterium]
MKTLLLTACLLFLLLPFANSQSYFYQTHKVKPDHHVIGSVESTDTARYQFMVDNYRADDSVYHSAFLGNQAQLINKYYSYPNDTSSLTDLNARNYFCINSVTVAFDSIYDIDSGKAFNPDILGTFGISTIYIPIIQVNHSFQKDSLEIQINQVDAYGYPISSPVLDTIIDSVYGAGNNYTIRTIQWNVGNYQFGGSKYAITMTYMDQSKRDSCWFIYGYGSKKDTCPIKNSFDSIALPTYFTKMPISPKPLIANSFAIWNEYRGYGLLPTEGGNNVYFPCDTLDKTFHPGIDGSNYLQDIHIYVKDTITIFTGVSAIHSPFTIINQNYPNPFTDKTTINYSINRTANVDFKVVDLTGRELQVQSFDNVKPGQHSILLDATKFSPGVYFYSFTSSGSTVTKKMVVY